jgi:flavin reductase (DIM6/NTAB) family NADH-FMN oxidoreductase RutF
VAWFECRIVSRVIAGDHVILIGEVEQFRRAADHPSPLLFHHGKYKSAGDELAP